MSGEPRGRGKRFTFSSQMCVSAYWSRGNPHRFGLPKAHIDVPPQHSFSNPESAFSKIGPTKPPDFLSKWEDCCSGNGAVSFPVVSQNSRNRLYLSGSTGRTSASDKLTALGKKLRLCWCLKLHLFVSQSYFVTCWMHSGSYFKNTQHFYDQKLV